MGAIALSYSLIGLGLRLALNNIFSWRIINKKRGNESAIAPNDAYMRVCSLVGFELSPETKSSSSSLAATLYVEVSSLQ